MTVRLCLFSLVLLTACGPKPGTRHLAPLEQALHQVDSAAAIYEQASHAAAGPAHARVDSALAIVEARLQGFAVNLEQGKPFSQLDERRRMLKCQPGRHRRISQEIDRTQRQIGLLIEAIVDGAKVDALGEPIDTAYFRQAAEDELRISSHLIKEMDIALDFLEKGLRDLDGLIRRADSASIALTTPPEPPI